MTVLSVYLLALLLHTTLLRTIGLKALHFVLKVNSMLLRNNIEFFENNFNFKTFRHEEFTSGCEATCNGIYGGPWSKTVIGLNSCDEATTFCLELISNYGIRSYEKGNDFRYLSFDKTYFLGSNDDIIISDDGNSFLQTPDGYYINLIDPNPGVLHINKPIQYASLHTTNLEESIFFYCNFLNAVESKTSNGNCLLTWGDNNIGIELIEYSKGELYRGTAHGRFAISTEKYRLEEISEKLKLFNYKNLILHGPVTLNPHNEEVIIIKDFDGHEYCFVDNIGYQNCIDAGKTNNVIDWQFRSSVEDNMIEKANQNLAAEFGECIKIWNSTMFNTRDDTKDLLIEIYAPWCELCQLRKPILQNVASNILKVTTELIVALIDGSDLSNINPNTNEYLQTILEYTRFQGYPQLFYIPKTNKQHPIAFEGAWRDNEILDWIKLHSTLSSLQISKLILQESHILDDDCDSCSL